jgi:predicted dehydrogenase
MTVRPPLRVAVVGAGAHAQDVIIPTLPAAGLVAVAVCARRLEHARTVAARFGIPAAHDSVEAACGAADAVLAAVPVDAFEPVLTTAIEARTPVFAEKPAAPSAAAARRLHALAQERGVPVLVGYMKRFAPAYQRLRESVGAPGFGTPSLVHVRWAMGPFANGRPLDDWVVENAVHGIDLARHVAGDLQDLDVAVSGRPGEHVVLARAVTAAGTAVSLQLCTTGPWWHDNELVEVFGTGTAARVENATTLVLRDNDGPERRWSPNFTIPAPRNLTGELLGFAGALRAFAQLARDGGPSPCDLEDAARTLDVAEAIVRAGA